MSLEDESEDLSLSRAGFSMTETLIVFGLVGIFLSVAVGQGSRLLRSHRLQQTAQLLHRYGWERVEKGLEEEKAYKKAWHERVHGPHPKWAVEGETVRAPISGVVFVLSQKDGAWNVGLGGGDKGESEAISSQDANELIKILGEDDAKSEGDGDKKKLTVRA